MCDLGHVVKVITSLQRGVVKGLPYPMWIDLWAGLDWAEGGRGQGQDTYLRKWVSFWSYREGGVAYQVV